MGKTKICCTRCQKKCSGEVLRVTDKYFHKQCFQCTTCHKSLASGGFFSKDGAFYCTTDYQKLFGTKCAACKLYVEGEVVSTMDNTYHQKCFTCSRCNQPFQSGSKVTNTGKGERFCEDCVAIPPNTKIHSSFNTQVNQSAVIDTNSPTLAKAQQHNQNNSLRALNDDDTYDPNACAGCKEQLKEGQALIALDRQWHISCFSCKNCNALLNGEYMGKDGTPYCEKCYQKLFGVKCAYCNRYISGKVLQAGDNHHFHPTCARCTKCGDPFGDGEEMYLQGSAVWHPRCGPCPSSELGAILDGSTLLGGNQLNGNITDTECDRLSNSVISEMQYRTVSPGLMLREYGGYGYDDISRIYTYSYLTDEPHYLRKPVDPYDKAPVSPHFHRPSNMGGSQAGSRPPSRPSSRNKSAMKVLVDSIRSETPRPKSPAMNNEEPIELSHYPAAKKPPPGEKAKIERDDFPAPPYPYTDPERRRRLSDSYKGVPVSDDEDEVDHANGDANTQDDLLKREEEELKKIKSGMGAVILKDLKEHAKYRKWKQHHIDPRNASRTPSASKELMYRLRYESPIGASPSRHLDHQKPFYDDETTFDRSTSYRGSVGRSLGTTPSYNAIHNFRSTPKFGIKSSTLPSHIGIKNGYSSEFSFGLGDKTQSTEFSCGKSDVSVDSITEGDRRALMADLPASSTYSGALSYHFPQTGLIRRSLPNMAHSVLVHEPAKIYPYHLLLISNYRLPADVDRCNLERHLSDVEFEAVLMCTRTDFYRLPQWRRNEIKRRARLF
ncbi:actin-binding LIM protein 3 isoform X4 [Contarinia nasturtii]|uniref:actin-binding LIM protein 3 isoform X4 n=1 Tax=Contarinia nasturtii TaxID=265458 RepID=UPI0012D4B9CF|nr:actin-binding LIM protein 3 isoform X4 [Contarinia nasturtii]